MQRTSRPQTMAMVVKVVGLPGVVAFDETWQTWKKCAAECSMIECPGDSGRIFRGTAGRPTGDGVKLCVFAVGALLRSALTVERRKGLRGQLRPFLAGIRKLLSRGVLP